MGVLADSSLLGTIAAWNSTQRRHDLDTIAHSSDKWWSTRRLREFRPMLTWLRACLMAALVCVSTLSATAADKPYHRDDLADAAIRLEGQIKADAGPVAKPLATLRRDADAAFARNDQRLGMQLLGQIVAVAPADAANWLRLARTILQIRPS